MYNALLIWPATYVDVITHVIIMWPQSGNHSLPSVVPRPCLTGRVLNMRMRLCSYG